MNTEMQHIYVNMPGHAPCFDTVAQALESLSCPGEAEPRLPSKYYESSGVIDRYISALPALVP